MLESSRRHGHYDERWSASSVHATFPERPIDSVDLESLDAWEGEGGSTPAPRFEDGALESVADGLSWEMFGETFYPGKRHFFPAIQAWSLYRDGDRSRPRSARQRARSS